MIQEPVMPEGWFLQILLALLGGILGVSIGGVAAFILCGVVAITGAVVSMLIPSPPFTSALAWGSFFGPHVAFSAGVAASAFAARAGKIANGKNILSPLISLRSPSVFVVGAVFGVTGYFLKSAFESLPTLGGLPLINAIAATVAISGVLARIAFGTGRERRIDAVTTKQWHPWTSNGVSLWVALTGLSIVSSTVGWLRPEYLGLVTAVAAASILAVLFGAKIPIWIHVAWAGEYGAAITNDPAAGVAFALGAALIAECIARKFLVRGATHIDPPASALAVISPAFAIVHLVYQGNGIGLYPSAVALLIFTIGAFSFLKEDASMAGQIAELPEKAKDRGGLSGGSGYG